MICETARRARQRQAEQERLRQEAQRAAAALCNSLRRLPQHQGRPTAG